MRNINRVSFLAFAAFYAAKGNAGTSAKEPEEKEAEVPGTALAEVKADGDMPASLIMGDNTEWEVSDVVTLDQMKLENDIVYAVQFTQPISEPDKDADGKVRMSGGMAAPYIAIVVDMRDGVEKSMIVNSVFLSAIRKRYPNDGYVGKHFLFKRTKSATGKRYVNFDIREIRPKTIEHKAS